MSKRRPQPLLPRLVLATVFLSIVAFVPPALLAYRVYWQSLEEHTLEQGRIAASALAAAATEPVADRQQAALQAVVQGIPGRGSKDVAFVVDTAGRVWAHSVPEKVGETFSAASHGEMYFDSTAPVGTLERPLAFAHVGLSRTWFERKLAAFRFALFLAVGIATLATALLAAALFDSLGRPLRRLAGALDVMASGDFTPGPQLTSGPAEIQVLAESVERLRQAEAARLGELQEANAQLDRRLHDLSLVCAVGEAMNRGDDSQGLLETIVASAVDGTSARVGAVFLAGERDGEVIVAAAKGLQKEGEADPWYRLLRENSLFIIEEGASMTWQPPQLPAEGSREEAEAVPAEGPSGEDGPLPDNTVEVANPRYLVGAPLRIGKQVAGAFLVAGNGNPPDREKTELVEAMAVQAARCVDQGRMVTASLTDGLTGLFVSRYFRTRLREEVRSAVRYHRQVSLLLLDIDDFGNLNETLGQPTGEAVLQVVAGCIVGTLRDDVDLAARWGGDEFAVLLPETGKDGARVVAERLRDTIRRQPMEVDGSTFRVSVCAGVATCPEDGVRPEVLLQRCVSSLQQAKQAGRGQVVVAQAESD
jgi:diguanylate cyclase (GGDEF)-like protein